MGTEEAQMKSENASINYDSIDINMRSLVKLLNSFNGIRTMGCCGGHKDPNSIQQPEGHWFVTFWVYKHGRDTILPLIQEFCQNRPHLQLEEYVCGIKKKRKWFALSGKGIPEQTRTELEEFVKTKLEILCKF